MNKTKAITAMSVEFDQISKMLAYSFLAGEINASKSQKKNKLAGVDLSSNNENTTLDIHSGEMSFGELESYYKDILNTIESTPEVQTSLTKLLNLDNTVN